ncbi:MAG TPA: hypothetical protein PKA88_09605 [Polyangiaceae bacterium]|nr:hypothetical protein [Polyangiaceae bacterium]
MSVGADAMFQSIRSQRRDRQTRAAYLSGRSRSPWLLAIALCIGCATTQPQAARLAPDGVAQEAAPPIDRGATYYESEIGGLSQEDVSEHFLALRPRLEDCVRRASGRMSTLGGRVNLRMRLDREGQVRWAYLNESTLGDRDAELCVLRLVKGRSWPKPLSGEGLAETSFEVEPAEVPTDLSGFKGRLLAERARAVTRRCRKGVRGEFRATAYVAGSGNVLSAGVAPSSEQAEAASDCVVEALRGLRVGPLAGAQTTAAKISFDLP